MIKIIVAIIICNHSCGTNFFNMVRKKKTTQKEKTTVSSTTDEQETKEKEIFEEAYKRAQRLAETVEEASKDLPPTVPGAKKIVTSKQFKKNIKNATIRPFVEQVKEEEK